MTALHTYTLESAVAGLESGDFSSVELTQSVLTAIEERDGELAGYLSVDPADASLLAKRVVHFRAVFGTHAR